MPITPIPPCKKSRVDQFIYVDFQSEQGANMCYIAKRVVTETGVKCLERQKADFMIALSKHVLNDEQIDHLISLETALKNAHLSEAKSCQLRIESVEQSRIWTRSRTQADANV